MLKLSDKKPLYKLSEVIKRNGDKVSWDKNKIINAVFRAMESVGEKSSKNNSLLIADKVEKDLLKNVKEGDVPKIEEIQDLVEKHLVLQDFYKTAKAFILYRKERENIRDKVEQVPEEVKNLFLESSKYFKNQLAEFVFMRTYSKWLIDKKRRETWVETVTRYMNFMKENLGKKLSEEEYQEIFNYIINMKVVPSMRLLWSSGEAAKHNSCAAFNCSFISPMELRDFSEIMYLLMSGCGVGFSCENQVVQELPIIKKQNKEVEISTCVVEDSKEGWGDALYTGMKIWYSGQDIIFDYSKLRPFGARLKTMGGRSSGPEGLKSLLDFVRGKILSKQGKRLSSLDVHDLTCKIGEIVVMGGVRRSALISFSDLDDMDMRHCKNGQFYLNYPYRSMSNNSTVYDEKPTSSQFMEEWLALAKSGSGERGIFNRGSLKKQMPQRRWKNFKKYLYNCATNPCQPSWATVLTQSGIKTIGDINVGDEIWSKEGWTIVINKVYNGKKSVYGYKTSAGIFYGTENHKIISFGEKIKVKNAKEIDILLGPQYKNPIFNEKDIMDGLIIGDGSVHKASNNLVHLCVGEKDLDYFDSEVDSLFIKKRKGINSYAYEVDTGIIYSELPRTFIRTIPQRFINGGFNKVCSFLRGLFSANGSICGGRVTLKTSSKWLCEQVQLMLSSIGISSYNTINKLSLVHFKNGNYTSKISYDINITKDRDRFANLIGFIQKYKQNKLKNIIDKVGKSKYSSIRPKITYKIRNISLIKLEEDVYDITVNNSSHTYWSGGLNVSNCGEVILRSKEMCNLSEVIARSDDTRESLLEKIKIATILGTYQSMLTNFPYISEEWKKNCDEERLLGVSITGHWDSKIIRNKDLLKELKDYSIKINQEYAERFGINPSVSTTVVKPSGTVSQLTDSCSGMHPRYSKFYIRRIRISASDPLFKILKDQKVPYHPEVGQDLSFATTFVFEFPVKSPEGSITRNELFALEQLEYWKLVKENYTEHNPSQTIYVSDEEWIEVANWVFKNWDIVGGLSFLPKSDHVYNLAPFEEITEEKYNELVSKFPKIDFSQLVNYELEDNTEGGELACTSEKCELTS